MRAFLVLIFPPHLPAPFLPRGILYAFSHTFFRSPIFPLRFDACVGFCSFSSLSHLLHRLTPSHATRLDAHAQAMPRLAVPSWLPAPRSSASAAAVPNPRCFLQPASIPLPQELSFRSSSGQAVLTLPPRFCFSLARSLDTPPMSGSWTVII